MATQYDHIGTDYNELRNTPQAKLIDYNVRATLSPLIRGAKVLDLACGTGHYTNTMRAWGASSVTGVDISRAMIEAAQAGAISEDIHFELGDCSVPRVFGSGDYDLVTGFWLLNYAATKAGMVDMFRTIAVNLRPGGTFVGVTPYPTEDPKGHCKKMRRVRPMQLGNVVLLPVQDLEDGLKTHLVTTVHSGNIEFENFYLRKSIYEDAARESALLGRLEWRSVEVPDRKLAGFDKKYGNGFWDTFRTVGHFGLLVVKNE